MLKEDARRAVLREWRQWPDKDGRTAAMEFYGWLRAERRDLLDFRCGKADKWQVVNGWIERHQQGF